MNAGMGNVALDFVAPDKAVDKWLGRAVLLASRDIIPMGAAQLRPLDGADTVVVPIAPDLNRSPVCDVAPPPAQRQVPQQQANLDYDSGSEPQQPTQTPKHFRQGPGQLGDAPNKRNQSHSDLVERTM